MNVRSHAVASFSEDVKSQAIPRTANVQHKYITRTSPALKYIFRRTVWESSQTKAIPRATRKFSGRGKNKI